MTSITYLTVSQLTRPDVAYAASKLAKYMHNLGPMARQIIFLKRTLRYLAGTSHRCLSYDFSKPPHLCGYYDGAHADDYNTCRSTMYRTFAKAAREGQWLTKVFTSLKHSAVTPIDLLTKPLAPEQFLKLPKQFVAKRPLQQPAQVQGGV